MRITASSLYRETVVDLDRTQEQIAVFQQQVSSGKRISKPSDDPQGAATAIGDRAELGTLDQYANATDSTTSKLSAADSSLSDITTQLTAAKGAAAASRGSLNNAVQRQAYVGQLQGIKDALVSDLNASFKGTYLFSGTKTTTVPYAVTGTSVSAYQGNATSASVDVDRQLAIPTTFDGESITKGSDPQDLFTQLDSLITAVGSGDAAGIDAGMAALDRALGRTAQVQTSVGVGLERLGVQDERLTTVKLAVTSRLSAVEEANLAQAIVGLTSAQTAQRAALGAAAALNQQTLMDFLR